MKRWYSFNDSTTIAEIELCEDAMFYIESCETKYKTDKFIVKRIYDCKYKNYNQEKFNNVDKIYKYILFDLDWKFCNYIDFYSMKNIVIDENINKQIRDYISAIVNGSKKQYFTDDKLIKNIFDILPETNEIAEIYGYVKYNNNLCIAGGYTSLQYHNKKFKDFLNSDIDIFILQNNISHDAYKNILEELLCFLDKKFAIKMILCNEKRYKAKKSGVFDVICEKIKRNINIVCTSRNSISELLLDFDASYCKTCFYGGETYITPDAKMSKDTNIVLFYKNDVDIKRINKAKNLGFEIINDIPFYNIGSLQKKAINVDNAIENFYIVIDWINEY